MYQKLRHAPALAVAILAGCSSAPKLDPVLKDVMSGIIEKVEGVPGTSVKEVQAIQTGNTVTGRMKINNGSDPFVDCTPYVTTGYKGPHTRIVCVALRTDHGIAVDTINPETLNSDGGVLNTWTIPDQTPGTPSWEATADQMGTDIVAFLETQK